MLNYIDVRCVLFNHIMLGACSFFMYHGPSLSWLCCCYCIMGGNTHMRTERPASHGKKVILRCATSNCMISSISGPATTRRGSYSVCVFLGAVGRVGSCHGSAFTPTRRCFPWWWTCFACLGWVRCACSTCAWPSKIIWFNICRYLTTARLVYASSCIRDLLCRGCAVVTASWLETRTGGPRDQSRTARELSWSVLLPTVRHLQFHDV